MSTPPNAQPCEDVPKSNSKVVPWIWEGLVAEEAVTLLSAPEKTGKTTLVSLLLDRRREGGDLLGRTVLPGRTVLCSEENPTLWSLRQPPLDFGSQVEYRRPPGTPTRRRWRSFINRVLDYPLDDDDRFMLVVDTAMNFLPAGQNNAIALRAALRELRVVAGMPAGVLLVHQTSAARTRTRARGPLAGFADILIDMQVPRGDRFTRRRDFYGVGRYPGTPEYLAAELNPDGTDYILLPDLSIPAVQAPQLPIIERILREAPEPLTRDEILARWPETNRQRADSLWRTLCRGCELGLFVRKGAGTKAEAFRYGMRERRSDG